MSIIGKTKINSIYDPFKGSSEVLLDLNTYALAGSFFSRLNLSKLKLLLAPRTFVLSHKSSPSNSMSYQGLLTDYYLLTEGNDSQKAIYKNIQNYLGVLKGHNLAR